MVVVVGDLAEAFGDEESTEAEQEVLEIAERNPDMKQTEIAEVSGWSESTVSRALRNHGDPAGKGRGESSSDESGGSAFKWILLVALVLGAFALLSEGESGGAESVVVVASFLDPEF